MSHRPHAAMIVLALASAALAQPLNRTPAPGEYQKPEETIKNLLLPDGFSAKLFAAEPDLVQPIGYAQDHRGRLWVIENLSYPHWKKEGNDRIVILDDTDGDGKFDKKTLFWDKGNFATGIAVGFGGVYVGTPPNLLFIPDKDGDDKPDGEAQVLLDGWGWQDTHETLNSFTWGPDGWLYGCQGVFTESNVGKPGTPKDERLKVTAAVWRFHPTKHTFEIFAEGGSNQWGVDFNDHGQAFITACVIPHIFHVSQGGRYHRQGGQHNNPHTYADIKTIRTHNHYAAAFAGCMVYLGDNFPAEYRNQIFMNNIHANKIHVDWIERKNSGFTAKFGPHDKPAGKEDRGTGWMNSQDKWYRGLNLQVAPDGGVYVCDWYDKLPCHQVQPHDQTTGFKTGRIYKFNYVKDGAPKAVKDVDLSKLSDVELATMQTHKNDWWVRQARRLLQERTAAGKDVSKATDMLLTTLGLDESPAHQLRALWALHVTTGIKEALTMELLGAENEYIRAWAIQCELEDNAASAAVLAKLAVLAKDEKSPVVRLYLASAAGRLPVAQRWAIVEELVKHEADKDDQNLPLMYWYAIEPLCAADKTRALKLAAASKVPTVTQFIARRVAAIK